MPIRHDLWMRGSLTAAMALFAVGMGLCQGIGSLPVTSSGGTSHIALPPRQVLEQTALSADISPDGRFLTVEQRPGPVDYLVAAAQVGIRGISPEEGSQVVVVQLDSGKLLPPFHLSKDVESWRMHWSARRGYGLLRVSSRSKSGEVWHELLPWNQRDGFGPAVRYSGEEAGEAAEYYPSPVEPFGLLVGQKVVFNTEGLPTSEELRLFRVNESGASVQTQKYKRETSGPQTGFWSSNGKTIYLPVRRNGGAEAVIKIDVEALDYELVSPLSIQAPQPVGLALVDSPEGWRLKGEAGPSDPIAPKGSKAVLSRNGERAAFVFAGAAFVREIAQVPTSDLAKAAYQAARTEAERKARDVGRALRYYWRDNFMRYPPRDKALVLLEPYLRSVDSLQGLEVSFPGGPLPNDTDTMTAPFGVIGSKYGRAVIMLDGSVAWREGRA